MICFCGTFLREPKSTTGGPLRVNHTKTIVWLTLASLQINACRKAYNVLYILYKRMLYLCNIRFRLCERNPFYLQQWDSVPVCRKN